jgi:uncharacterized protein YrzB (UPF0473 family)
MDESAFGEEPINLEGEDGRSHPYRLLGMFPFEGQEYVLLMPAGESNAEGAGADGPALMRLVQRGDQAVFQTIESDEEFERVTAFIKEAARELDGESTGD